MPDELVLGHGSRRTFRNSHQTATAEHPYRCLHRRFREPGHFRELREAERHAPLLLPEERAPEGEIDEKSARRVVMTSQVGHQNIEHVGVDGDMVHRTIV